jgi:anti-sigma regulatory factor (Ser/Thr protein kinase)
MSATQNHLSLILKNDPAEIAPLSRIVDAMGQKHGVPAEALYAVNLALDEILTNVISYGYSDQGEHEILVRLDLEAGEFTAEIEDDAQPFNPLAAAAPDVEAPLHEKPIGGLGIHLAKTMMDGIAYRREGEKNILTMTKKFVIDHKD